MKYIKFWIIAALLFISYCTGFLIGRNYEDKYYTSEDNKAACLFSDAIRIEYDLIEDSVKNCTYSAYSALEESCCELNIDTDSLLKQYTWCY